MDTKPSKFITAEHIFTGAEVAVGRNSSVTDEQIEAIFAEFDQNGDGQMSKKEFTQAMRSHFDNV